MKRSGSTNILGRFIPIASSTTLVMVALFFVASGADAGKRETRPPNVVVILVDDLGRADIGPPVSSTSESPFNRARIRARQIVYPPHELVPGSVRLGGSEPVGFQITPHIERLFEQGIVLSQYLNHTVCSPSRAGLLTGRHYTRVGSGPQIGGTLRLDVTNVARDLQSNGYTTAVFGKWHNGYPNFPADGNGSVVSGRDQTDPGNDWFENYKKIPWGPGVNAYGFDEWQGFYGGAVDYFNRLSWWNNDTSWWTGQRYTPHITGHTVDLVSAADLDGRDGFSALLDRTPIHPLEESTFISFNQDWAVVRADAGSYSSAKPDHDNRSNSMTLKTTHSRGSMSEHHTPKSRNASSEISAVS